MDTATFAAVLAAALMHAGWNAVVKVGLDRFSSVLLLALVQSALALALLPFFPPPAAASWPWLAASALLHTGYKLFLIRAYAHGDLGQVYPVARGAAPLIVALVGAAFLGEAPTPGKALAVLAIGGGVVLMSTEEGGRPAASRKALAWALGTAAFTASYPVVDGVGARLAGPRPASRSGCSWATGSGCSPTRSPRAVRGACPASRPLGGAASRPAPCPSAPTGSPSGPSPGRPSRSLRRSGKPACSSPCPSRISCSASAPGRGAGAPPR